MKTTLLALLALGLCLSSTAADKKKPGTVLWESKTGSLVSSSPAIGSDGTVYVGSADRKLYAINGKSGVKLWEYRAGEGTQITNKPAYTVVPTKTPPIIDGKIDDAVWQAAEFTELYAFVPLTEQKKIKADPATTFALSADSKNLYVAFRCMDPDMGKLKKTVTERDGKVYRDDYVEIFMDFDGDKRHLARIILSAGGVLFDSAYMQRGLSSSGGNYKGLQGKISLEADQWTGELLIPFAGLGVRPDQKLNWSINISRANWSVRAERGAWLSSWGCLAKNPAKVNITTFEPARIIEALGKMDGYYDILQTVGGIPQPVYSAEERAAVVKWRKNMKLDMNPEDFPMVVIPPHLPLESIMVYNDKDGNKQTIKTAEHFKLKRQQTLEALQKVMGKLPERPKRTSLKDFNIRVSEELTKVRGRYTKQTIHFFVAKDEEVHANLYIPLNMKPGEKRPAIVGMHPFSRAGKGSFEKWPNLNFVIELAMQGFIVIMLDYPGFGEALDYEYDNPRYGSGRIHGVYNHMSTVDLLQLHPLVDGENIGTIGHSLGGGNAMFLTVFDERVKMSITSCGWSTFRNKSLLTEKKLASKTYLPRLKTVYNLDLTKFPFEYTEVIGAIAPRVFFSNSPLNDGVQSGYRPKAAAPFISEYFEAMGVKDNFIFLQPAGGHDFPWTYRHLAYKKLRATLNYHPHGALGLLTDRKGKAAIPTLKKALEDPEQKTRRIAAHHLGALGDKSGVEQMKQDLKKLAPLNGKRDSLDAKGHAQLEEALEVAMVLGELGDASAYPLASHLVVNGTAQEKWRSIVVLLRIANTDNAALKAAGMDPIGLLKEIAVHEEDDEVFFMFLDRVHKILRSRPDMIDLLALAKINIHHQTPPSNGPYQSRYTRAHGFHQQAVKDRNSPYEWK